MSPTGRQGQGGEPGVNGSPAGGAVDRDVRSRRQSLSPREREVLTLLAIGLTGTQIAQRLFISAETVRIHVRNARRRLGAKTRTQAVAIALQTGEIRLAAPPPDTGR